MAIVTVTVVTVEVDRQPASRQGKVISTSSSSNGSSDSNDNGACNTRSSTAIRRPTVSPPKVRTRGHQVLCVQAVWRFTRCGVLSLKTFGRLRLGDGSL